jgi:hypothetical protein
MAALVVVTIVPPLASVVTTVHIVPAVLPVRLFVMSSTACMPVARPIAMLRRLVLPVAVTPAVVITSAGIN